MITRQRSTGRTWASAWAAVTLGMVALVFTAAGGHAMAATASENTPPPDVTPDVTRLVSPFDVTAARARHGSPATSKPCGTPPPVVHDLTLEGFYKPGTNSSVVDPERMAAYRAARKPVDVFEKEIVARSDAYVASAPPAVADARCVLHWLAAWAEGGAYLGKVSHQGGFNRKWSLALASAAYLKIIDEPALDPLKRQTVEGWLSTLGGVVRDDYSSRTDLGSRRNNHLYWATWAVAAAAVAANDRALLAWAFDRYRFALRQVDADGTLPLEIARRSKALHYHLFAVEPLVMIAEVGTRNGTNLFDAEGGALHRLVAATLAGLDDPSAIAARAGTAQDFVSKLNAGQIAWLEVYAARYPSAAATRWLEQMRPLKSARIGGNLTVLFSGRGAAH